MSLKKYKSQGKALEVTLNSKEGTFVWISSKNSASVVFAGYGKGMPAATQSSSDEHSGQETNTCACTVVCSGNASVLLCINEYAKITLSGHTLLPELIIYSF